MINKGFKTFFKAFSTSILETYDSKSDYFGLATDISDTHQQMEKAYDEIAARLKDLNTQSQNWTINFEKVKVILEQINNFSNNRKKEKRQE